jgi:hypothetical protein
MKSNEPKGNQRKPKVTKGNQKKLKESRVKKWKKKR